MIRAFIVYYFSPTLKNWRALRRLCMAQLPKEEQKAAIKVAARG